MVCILSSSCGALEPTLRTSSATISPFGDATTIGILVGAGFSVDGDEASAMTEGTGMSMNLAADGFGCGGLVRVK